MIIKCSGVIGDVRNPADSINIKSFYRLAICFRSTAIGNNLDVYKNTRGRYIFRQSESLGDTITSLLFFITNIIILTYNKGYIDNT